MNIVALQGIVCCKNRSRPQDRVALAMRVGLVRSYANTLRQRGFNFAQDLPRARRRRAARSMARVLVARFTQIDTIVIPANAGIQTKPQAR